MSVIKSACMTIKSDGCSEYTTLLQHPDATPGLQYLVPFFSARDSLKPWDESPKKQLEAHPLARIIHNELAPAPIMSREQINAAAARSDVLRKQIEQADGEFLNLVETARDATVRKVDKRASVLQSISRRLLVARDLENEDGSRTVMFESIIEHVFKADPSSPAFMAEAGTIELVPVPQDEIDRGYGFAKYWAMEIRIWHDRTALLKKRTELSA
jgi:hypothetical protein